MEKRTQQGKLTNLEIASFCSEVWDFFPGGS